MVSVAASQQESAGFESSLSAWSLRVLHASVCVLFRDSGFLSQSRDVHGVRVIGDTKLPIGVNVRANGYLSLCVSPVGRLAIYPGCTCLSLYASRDRLQPLP